MLKEHPQNENQAKEQKIIRILKAHKGRITHHALLRGLQSSIRAHELKDLLAGLCESGRIEKQEIKPKRGPSSTAYKLVRNQNAQRRPTMAEQSALDAVPAKAQPDNHNHFMKVHALAANIAASISRNLFDTLIVDPEQDINHCRYTLSLTMGKAGHDNKVHIVKVPDGVIVSSLESLPAKILDLDDMQLKERDLTNLMNACAERLSKME